MKRTCRSLALAGLLSIATSAGWAYDITIIGGTVHGPGPLPDTPLPPGMLTHISLDERLNGVSEFFNDGDKPPNVPGEMEVYGHLGSRLSNGVPFNKHLWGGVVSMGQGALKMLQVVASDGDMKGTETYRLNDRLNWVIHTDLALDAGFPQGLVITRNITITTGVLYVPISVQSEGGFKGGFDQAGSLPSGVPVVGMLGDMAERGFLDGKIVGASRVPLSFMFMPGGPLLMERVIRSNIPVTREEAGILTLAGLGNLREVLGVAKEGSTANPAARAYVLAHAKTYLDDFAARAGSAHSLLSSAGPERKPLADLAAECEALLKEESKAAEAWPHASAIPADNFAALLTVLDRVDQAVSTLRDGFHISQLGKPPTDQGSK